MDRIQNGSSARDEPRWRSYSFITRLEAVPTRRQPCRARHGIPAFRLVAGFDRPQCNIRYILTGGDTREKVAPAELAAAARVTAVLLARALTAGDEELAELRKR